MEVRRLVTLQALRWISFSLDAALEQVAQHHHWLPRFSRDDGCVLLQVPLLIEKVEAIRHDYENRRLRHHGLARVLCEVTIYGCSLLE